MVPQPLIPTAAVLPDKELQRLFGRVCREPLVGRLTLSRRARDAHCGRRANAASLPDGQLISILAGARKYRSLTVAGGTQGSLRGCAFFFLWLFDPPTT